MVRQMKKVALSELKDDLSKYLRLAERDELILTRHGKPAGVLVGRVAVVRATDGSRLSYGRIPGVSEDYVPQAPMRSTNS